MRLISKVNGYGLFLMMLGERSQEEDEAIEKLKRDLAYKSYEWHIERDEENSIQSPCSKEKELEDECSFNSGNGLSGLREKSTSKASSNEEASFLRKHCRDSSEEEKGVTYFNKMRAVSQEPNEGKNHSNACFNNLLRPRIGVHHINDNNTTQEAEKEANEAFQVGRKISQVKDNREVNGYKGKKATLKRKPQKSQRVFITEEDAMSQSSPLLPTPNKHFINKKEKDQPVNCLPLNIFSPIPQCTANQFYLQSPLNQNTVASQTLIAPHKRNHQTFSMKAIPFSL